VLESEVKRLHVGSLMLISGDGGDSWGKCIAMADASKALKGGLIRGRVKVCIPSVCWESRRQVTIQITSDHIRLED